MVAAPRLGEVWWAEAEDKRRPVLIVTRSEAIPVLTSIIVAPVTRIIRGIATEVPLGVGDGLQESCVASFDNVQPLHRGFLTSRISQTDDRRRQEICGALAALADC